MSSSMNLPQSSNPCPLSTRGFSLIELLVVIAIAGILLAIGVPNLQGFIASNRVSSSANEFLTALQQARSEATRRGATAILRSRGTAGSGDFGAGWDLFFDADNDNTIDAGEVVRSGGPVGGQMTLRGSTGAFGTDIRFDGAGRLNAAGLVVLCFNGALNDSRALILDRNGRVRAAVLNSSRVPLDESGTALTTCTPA